MRSPFRVQPAMPVPEKDANLAAANPEPTHIATGD
jgi:hypothetical protein